MDKNDVLRQAENSLNLSEFKKATAEIMELIPSIVDLNKRTYDEMLKKGFNERQAFEFACSYTLKVVFQKG